MVEVGAERREGTGPRAQTAQTQLGRTQWRWGGEERVKRGINNDCYASWNPCMDGGVSEQ